MNLCRQIRCKQVAANDKARRARRKTCATSSSSSSSSSRVLLREDLLKSIQGTSRGQRSTASERRAILQKIEVLESKNVLGVEETRKQLQGNWVLLYQAPTKDEKDMNDYEKRSVTVEGPFLSFFKPVTKDLVRTMANVQKIDVDDERIENIAEFKVAGTWRGKLVIDGRVVLGEMREEEKDDAAAAALKAYVTFSSFSLSWEGERILSVPVDRLFELIGKGPPEGWLQTTYMDDEIRVGRGDKGSVFVAKRIRTTEKQG